MPFHLQTGGAVSEIRGAGGLVAPPDRVAGADQETGRIDCGRCAKKVEQVPATGWQRLAERPRPVDGFVE